MFSHLRQHKIPTDQVIFLRARHGQNIQCATQDGGVRCVDQNYGQWEAVKLKAVDINK